MLTGCLTVPLTSGFGSACKKGTFALCHSLSSYSCLDMHDALYRLPTWLTLWQYHWLVGSGQLTRKEAFKQLEEKQEAAAQADAETEDSWRYVCSCRKCFCFLPACLNCYVSWRYALSCHKWFWICLPLWTAMGLHSILCASFVFWLAGGMHFHAMNGSVPSCLWTAMCLHSIQYAFLFDFHLLRSHLSVNVHICWQYD